MITSSSKVASGDPGPARRLQWRTMPRPVTAFAGIGVLFIGCGAWVLSRWIIDGGLHPVAYSGKISTGLAAWLWVVQFLVIACVVLVAWYGIYTSCREGRVSAFAALTFGFFTVFWMDPIVDYRIHGLSTNYDFLHTSSWGPCIPGWDGIEPSRQIEMLAGPSGLLFTLTIIGVWIAWLPVRQIIHSRPHWGAIKILAATSLIGIVVDILFESFFFVARMYSWCQSTPFALFGGHWYQLPLYEIFLITFSQIVPPVMLLQWAHRTGVDVWFLRGSNRTWLRLLAGAGLINPLLLIYLICIQISFLIFPGPVPPDTPAYLRLEL